MSGFVDVLISMFKYKFLSFVFCFVLMCAAAFCVNNALFGHRFGEGKTEAPGSSGQPDVSAVTRISDNSAVINTAGLTDIRGYAGATPLSIEVREGRIVAITPLENGETPHFFENASMLLDNYIGKTPAEAATIPVDAVSGATFSSNALIANVRAGAKAYAEMPVESDGPKMLWKMWVAFAVSLAACLLPLFVKSRIYNIVQMCVNIGVLGFWCGAFLDYSEMMNWLSFGIPLPLGLAAIVMLVAAFIFPLFGYPQHYCMHICPLGSAQMLVASACRHKVKIPARVVRGLEWFRRILWASLMIFLMLGFWTEWMDLELFQAFVVESAPVGIIIAAACFVALSAIVPRPYCRFVCPTGSLIKASENIDYGVRPNTRK